MAKNIDHILHKKSNVVNSGAPKALEANAIEYGEIAINYAAGNETLFIKNSANEIVPFSAAGSEVELNLSGYTHDPSVSTTAYTNESAVTSSSGYDTIISGGTGQTINDAFAKVEKEIIGLWKMIGKNNFDKDSYGTPIYDQIIDDEKVTAEALTDLDTRVNTISGAVEDVSGLSGAVTSVTPSGMTASIANNNLTINTNANKVMLDAFTHDTQVSTTAYTNESAVTSTANYHNILSGGTDVCINEALSLLEKEIIGIWKMLGKNNLDKEHYGSTVYDWLNSVDMVTAQSSIDLNNRLESLSDQYAITKGKVDNNSVIIDFLVESNIKTTQIESMQRQLDALTKTVADNELATAAALNDLNNRIGI